MKKVIYFYGEESLKKHKGLAGLKKFARSNRYLLRDANLSDINGFIEPADEYKGELPQAYKDHLKGVEDASKTETENKTENKDEGKTPSDLIDPTA